MSRRIGLSLSVFVALAVAALGLTLLSGNRPQLGLDLQGGASVVLEPNRRVSGDIIDQSIEIIRSRVDALGVAEPDIRRQGNAIVVDLPGVKEQDRALRIVGQTAQLHFRPVLAELPPETASTSTTTTQPGQPPAQDPASIPTTPPEEDDPKGTVVLPQLDDGKVVARYQLGPSEGTGRIIKTARAEFPQGGGQWQVTFEQRGSTFADLTRKYQGQRLAIVLDHLVESAPTINSVIDTDGVITGDFTEREAKDLALVLRFGALPVTLEPQTVQRVSPTLGRDSLQAGIVAGLVGLGLVLLYMIAYYRALGLVVLLGLCVTGAIMWSLVSFLGETSGLALTLAGATGIIVSVGVTVDSYVVYFERLKDEIRSGKTIRSSVDRGFTRAYRTIFAADSASFIGAALLYLLTVGSVRGFAFFLGISTLLDLVTAYFFTRPMVIFLGRNRLFTEARFLGVARGLAAAPAGGGG